MNAAVAQLPVARDTREPAPTDTSVRHYLGPLASFLERDDVLEVCVNRPGEATVETDAGAWETHPLPKLTYEHCRALARAVATYTNQAVSEGSPFLSATLPDGERVQIVMPPAVPFDVVSVTIRKPSQTIYTVEDFAAQGLFDETDVFADSAAAVAASPAKLRDAEHELLELLRQGHVGEFLRQAVRHRRNIVVSGATGSGKTTIMKGIVQECATDERIITIEDARELLLPKHRNAVHLLFGQNSRGGPKVTTAECLKSCKRQRPDRILLAEIRAEECFDYLEIAASGHPGSITSLHAGTCAEVFGQMQKMVRRHEAGRGLSEAEIQQDLKLKVDVIVQCAKERSRNGALRRQVTEVWYRPLRKRALQLECL
jgi:type IV secretion system protein VirB11